MAGLEYNGISYSEMMEETRSQFQSGVTRSKAWRVEQLQACIRLLQENEDQFVDALKKDLNKDRFDSLVDEINLCLNEANWFIENLDSLMKNKKVACDLMNIGGECFLCYQPYGVVLNITAWNYPVQLAFSPLINIIAAGNCCIVKPSELSAHTAKLIEELLPEYMDSKCIKCVTGGVPETTALLELKWDHIMYTGSGAVGKVVYAAAAKHLTKCTLELGGKCPVYVDQDSNLESVSNRLAWMKWKNAGQTCLAADYILVHRSTAKPFLQALQEAVTSMYTRNAAESPDYCRIVNARHFRRLTDMLDSSKAKQVVYGGDTDAAQNYFGPTIVMDMAMDDKLMQEEIFGPILPVIVVNNHQEAITFINNRDRPLHTYVFSNTRKVIDDFINGTSSGGFMANDAMIFKLVPGYPFGGVGESGFGCYGGNNGFINFSHAKPVLIKNQGMEWLFKLMRYAPHSDKKLLWLKRSQVIPNKIVGVCKWLLPVLLVLTGLGIFFGLAKGGKLDELSGYIPKVEL